LVGPDSAFCRGGRPPRPENDCEREKLALEEQLLELAAAAGGGVDALPAVLVRERCVGGGRSWTAVDAILGWPASGREKDVDVGGVSQEGASWRTGARATGLSSDESLSSARPSEVTRCWPDST